jgi:hypothetical protein
VVVAELGLVPDKREVIAPAPRKEPELIAVLVPNFEVLVQLKPK